MGHLLLLLNMNRAGSWGSTESINGHGTASIIDPAWSSPKCVQVGIVGRTGCGKSTLMMSLFRVVEPSSGSISIDGIDIQSVGLFDLRSRLALVPQACWIDCFSSSSLLGPCSSTSACPPTDFEQHLSGVRQGMMDDALSAQHTAGKV